MGTIERPESLEGSTWGRNEEAKEWGQVLSLQNHEPLTPPHPLAAS